VGVETGVPSVIELNGIPVLSESDPAERVTLGR
jgi:hypothetical protein